MKPVILVLAITALFVASADGQPTGQDHSSGASEEGLGRAHMDTSCAPTVAAEFNRALALLHNFWYARAFERFDQIARNDPECAMAYWGEAMTYNHPFLGSAVTGGRNSRMGTRAKGNGGTESFCTRETLSRCSRRAVQGRRGRDQRRA